MTLSDNTKIIFFNKQFGRVGWNNVYSLRWSGNLNPEKEKLLLEKGYFEKDDPEFIEMFVLEKAIPVKYRSDLYKTRSNSAYENVKKILENRS